MAGLFSRHCPKIHSGFSPKADSGVGSTAIGALIHERKTMCCEKDEEYIEIHKCPTVN
jgi:hypothetical protein